MTERFLCNRAKYENFRYANAKGDEHYFREDGTCSYCGSQSEEAFFQCIEEGAELGPTDKSYKVYLRAALNGKKFKQTYRNCPSGSNCKGPDDCTHWVTREVTDSKFYFQHLSDSGMEKFVELLNSKKLNIGYPGYFYTRPFFISYKNPETVN